MLSASAISCRYLASWKVPGLNLAKFRFCTVLINLNVFKLKFYRTCTWPRGAVRRRSWPPRGSWVSDTLTGARRFWLANSSAAGRGLRAPQPIPRACGRVERWCAERRKPMRRRKMPLGKLHRAPATAPSRSMAPASLLSAVSLNLNLNLMGNSTITVNGSCLTAFCRLMSSGVLDVFEQILLCAGHVRWMSRVPTQRP
eukprot:SAG31_NODE_1046_length_10177_cov_13.677218_7_plen_199_part_00